MVADQIAELVDDHQGILEQVPLELVEVEGPDEVVQRLLQPKLGEPRLEAQAEVLQAGRRLIYVDGRVTRDGELVACAQATFARVETI